MRFMVIVKATKDSEAGAHPPAAIMAAVGKLAEESTRKGTLVSTGGLMPSSNGARVHLAGGKLTVTDGPFAEAKELVGGWAFIEVKSKEEAIREARAFMQLHADVLGPSYEMDCEVRQAYENVPGQTS
jgi:hypothetical protein